MIKISPRRRRLLDAIHARMRTRLTLLRLSLIDVFAASLYHPTDGTDARVLDLLEQFTDDVVALESVWCAWHADYERKADQRLEAALRRQYGKAQERSGRAPGVKKGRPIRPR